MRKLKIIVFILSCSFVGYSQYLHTPADVQNIINRSTRGYIFDTLLNASAPSSVQIISNKFEFSTSQQDNFIDLSEFQLNKKTRKCLKKARNYFSSGKYDKAFNYYQKVYSTIEAAQILPVLAYCSEQINDDEGALVFYNQTLQLSPDDAEAHFAIANIEHKSGNIETAFKHINWAHLYDRNHPVYLDTLISIYRSKGLHYQNLTFRAQYHLHENADSNIVIQSADSPWKSYAACKAIWEFEPGYKGKMKYLSSSDVRIIEEKECLLNALISFEKLQDEKALYPILAILARALPEKRINDFIFYEMTSRKHPSMMKQLSNERLEQLVDYIVTYRVTHLVN